MKALLSLACAAACITSSFASETLAPLKASSMVGTWTLNGKVRAVRFDLKPNGTFEHRGYGSQSKGRWNVEGSQIRLRWTEIDSSSVDAKKVTSVYSLADGALKIGKFEYRKGSLAKA